MFEDQLPKLLNTKNRLNVTELLTKTKTLTKYTKNVKKYRSLRTSGDAQSLRSSITLRAEQLNVVRAVNRQPGSRPGDS